MVSILFAALAQTPTVPTIVLSDGKTVAVRSCDIGTSRDLASLKNSSADLIVVRFDTWGPKPEAIAQSLRNGPKGRRIVLVDFPAMAAHPNNALLWRTDWDRNKDGKLDSDAPTWLRPRNAAGFYPLDSGSPTLRSRLLGPTGLVATVAKAGFDGIVLSTVPGAKSRNLGMDARLASDLMSQGRQSRSGFLVFVRNPGKMMDYPAIRNYMDGYVADGLFFGREKIGEPSDSEFVADSVKRLEWASKKLKVVMAVAYTSDPDQIEEHRRLALERKFFPIALPKRLDVVEPLPR